MESGIEGLVHVSEMSWTRKNMHAGKIVSTSEKVEVVVLELDTEKRRISLGMKQCQSNPWEALKDSYKIGEVIEGEIKSLTEFGIFIGLGNDLDGLIHLSDLDWNIQGEEAIKKYKKGDVINAKLLEIDIEKERVSLGIKQLTDDPLSGASDIKKGSTVTCVIKEILEKEMIVEISKGIRGVIKKSDLAKERSEQRLDRFALEEKVDARVLSLDTKSRQISLSIKSLEVEEEQKALKQYGSADSGASLGDILGAALEKKAEVSKDDSKKKTSKSKNKKDKDNSLSENGKKTGDTNLPGEKKSKIDSKAKTESKAKKDSKAKTESKAKKEPKEKTDSKAEADKTKKKS